MFTRQSAPLSNNYIGYKLTTVAIVFLVLEVAFVALRFLARYLARAPFGLDDFFIVPALLFCWGICILAIRMSIAINIRPRPLTVGK